MIKTANFTNRKACISCGCTTLNELSSGRFDEGAVHRFIDESPWGEHPAHFLKGLPWSFVSCKDCNLMFHRYILDPIWNERRFSKWMTQEAIETFEKPFKTPENDFRKAAQHTAHVLRIEQLTRNIRGTNRVKLLDFGCGYGEFLSMCSKFGFDAVGVDRSSAKRDNGSYAKVFPEIEDITNIAPFHVLTLFEVLEHVDEPHNLMLYLRDLLIKDGILVLETPDCTGVNNIETRYDYDKIHPLEHINGFTLDTLTSFAARLGFVRITKPSTIVACDTKKIIKGVAKKLVNHILKSSTQLYFRKL